MTRPPADPPTNALALELGRALDRAAHLRRDAQALAAARSDPRSRVVVVHRSLGLVRIGDEPRVQRLSFEQLDSWSWTDDDLLYLGTRRQESVSDSDGPEHLFAVDVSALDPSDLSLAEQDELVELRQFAGLLPPEDANLIATARAMSTWHRNHRHCGRCGAPTQSVDAGHLRRCTDCGFEIFPRTDPAVIMMVHDGGDRCLLGRQASWPPGVYSTLAGFVEPGESLEMAVAREVREETGVKVLSAHYHSSQPWPFPTSIMLGFWALAEHADGAIAQDDELEDARWFSRQELPDLLATKTVRLPPPMSIARRLIDDWCSLR